MARLSSSTACSFLPLMAFFPVLTAFVFPLQDLCGHVQSAVAHVVFVQVRVAVVAGADDIKVLFPVVDGPSARARLISVFLFVLDEPLYEAFCEFNVGVKVIT